MSSLVVEWCELAGRRVVGVRWRSRGHWCSAWPGLGGVLSTTAWDPAPGGKIALCPLVAPAKVQTPANFLACIVAGSFHVVGTICYSLTCAVLNFAICDVGDPRLPSVKILLWIARMERGLHAMIELEMCINFTQLYLRNG